MNGKIKRLSACYSVAPTTYNRLTLLTLGKHLPKAFLIVTYMLKINIYLHLF
jgi:hypothetical protein